MTNGLDLGSPRWAELRHAYGPATDTPRLLQMAADGNDDAVAELFGSTLHQNSVYSASYAAVPHLVAAAVRPLAVGIRADLLVLAGGIHAWSDPAVLNDLPGDLRGPYEAAVAAALASALALLPLVTDETQAIYLLEAVAALGGRPAAGRVLSGLSVKEFSPSCPGCGVDLYVWPHETGLHTAAEDPVSRPATPRVPVRVGIPEASSVHAELPWLQSVATTSTALRSVAMLLPSLYGIARCPSCGCEFGLMERLWDEQREHAA